MDEQSSASHATPGAPQASNVTQGPALASHVTPTTPHAADATTPKKKRRHLWIWAVVLLLFAGLFYWVIQHQQKSQAAGGGGRRAGMGGPVPVTTATAKKGSMGIYYDALGTVTPVYTNTITAQVTGVVTQVHYREGQMVRKGDPLIDLDDRLYQAQLAQAQGTLEHDKQVLAQADMDLERYKQAWAKNAIPRQTLEDQEKLALQQQGTVKNDEGVVEYDQVQVEYCHITAPISGRVGLRLVDPGNLVTANGTATLVVITQIAPITVVYTLAEDNLPQVQKQTKSKQALTVEAMDRSLTGHLATGKLSSIDNQIDTSTGTVKMRAMFDNKDGALFPNQFVNTRMLVQTLQDQVIIPSSAIQHNGSEDFVYLLVSAKTGQPVSDVSACSTGTGSGGQGSGGQDSGANAGAKHGGGKAAAGQQTGPPPPCKVAMTSVKSGHSESGNTIVTSGLGAGAVIADSSFEKLIDGAPITISKVKLPSTSETSESPAP
ncbi:efflux RND transporter periplasmic adaptor subunit [Terracidiphilus gabretensis]|jgi:multidrug efflux system membrane fusion protein|uniref:efflux RND transporter periplasmic adaptor subunit n=1 Tax=Terracidiphilus gabretensis TaxID=1577687 RepID=UPI00071B032E|nr:efflux RND transporter periplasmic adaptor subunit [Terracidiphilus gabretensis]